MTEPGWLVRVVLLLALPAASLAAAPAAADAEEGRLDAAAALLPSLNLQAAEGYLRAAVAASAAPAAALAAARQAGIALWRDERRRVQDGGADDRGLYWRRLAAKRGFRQACAAPQPCAEVLQAFELATRGIDDLSFDGAARRRVVVTGFDPFNLDARVDQSNPSGLAALRFDDTSLGGPAAGARIQALVLPVRFADFDQGLVEAVLTPLLNGGDLDLLVTVSMGRDGFDLERFPARRRSAAAPDNQRVRTGASVATPQVPRLGAGLLPGPEFVEFSLPVARMLKVQQPFAVRDNRRVVTRERGPVEAASLAELAEQTAVSGSGGGYLSNEVSFRAVRLAAALGSRVPVGHIHTPRVQGYEAATEAAIVDQLAALLEAALESRP